LKLAFSKYQGAGNHFILFDDRENLFPIQKEGVIARLCHRQYGIGADGLILLQISKRADARMRIFNADGSEAEMCGNGLRCLFRFMQDLNICKQSAQIETTHSIFTCTAHGEKVGILHPLPTFLQVNVQVGSHHLNVIDSGVPHAVAFVSDIEEVDVLTEGKKIRFHPLFGRAGVNATFVQSIDNALAIRTYERGVEEETLACGTAAIAAAFAAQYLLSQNGTVKVQTRSKEVFTIEIKENGMELKGPAMLVFCGGIIL
jgi:diaminopimelate epimerase